MYSKYYEEFDTVAKKRYREKLTLDIAGLSCDPYISTVISGNSQLWPKVEYPDIFNYLINTTSSYTKERLKAYKSLDGFLCKVGYGKLKLLYTERWRRGCS